jgi:hypothetical protein
MSISDAVPQSVSRRRHIVFFIACGIVALALLPSMLNLLAPWMTVNIEGLANPAQLRWDLALEGGVDFLVLVCLVITLARPDRPALLVQYVLYATVLAAAVIVPFSPPFLINVAVFLLVPLTYPYRRELFSLQSRQGPSVAMFAVAAVAAAVLLPIAVQPLRTQMTLPRGNGSDLNTLASNAQHLMLLALAGLLAATRRPGWKVIAFGVTVTYTYLAVASLLLPNQPHSWGVAGGVASLLAAAAFGIAATVASRPVSLDTHGSRTAPRL